MSREPRFFEHEFTVNPDDKGNFEAVFHTPVPAWVLWGRPASVFMVSKDIDPKRLSQFVVLIRLSKGRLRSPEQSLALTAETISDTGDSYYDCKGWHSDIEFSIESRRVRFKPIANSEDRLAGFESSHLDDVSFDVAVGLAKVAANLLTVSVTAWSKIPCTVDTVVVRSIDTAQQYGRATLPYPVCPLAIEGFQSIPAMEPFIAALVEGLSEFSSFYRFLCFFKIVEKLLSLVLGKLRAAGQRCGVEGPDFSGMVPSDPFEKVAPEFIGTKYTTLRDQLQTQYRNAIAHLDLTSPVLPFSVAAEAEMAKAEKVMAFVAYDLLYRAYEFLKVLQNAGCDVATLSFE